MTPSDVLHSYYNINLEKVNTQMLFFWIQKKKITDSFHITDIFRNFTG